MIERLALDSPDQFVLAQLRGASYYTIARDVVPGGVGDDYDGPVWDVIRVGESEANEKKPESLWRIYYVNSRTGLIDKIESQHNDQLITVELGDWGDHSGELSPGRIRWLANSEVLMEFALNSVSNGPRQ